MTADVESWPYDAVLASYLEGELAPLEAARVEAALAESSSLRLRLRQLRQVRDLLSAPLAQLEHIDLTSAVRSRIEQRSGPPHRQEKNLTVQRRWGIGFALTACAALILIGVERAGEPLENAAQVRFKGAVTGSSDERPTRATLHTYRVGPDGSAVPLTASFSRSDGLLFSYTNVGPNPYRYLAVFAIDASKQVRWFYPAYERADSKPISTSIEGEQVQALLPDVIHHDYAVGPLTLFALFSRKPVRVSEVEHWLEHQRLDDTDALSPGSLLSSRRLEVTR